MQGIMNEDRRRQVLALVAVAAGLEEEEHRAAGEAARARQREVEEEERRRRDAPRRLWCRQWIARRGQFGWYEQLMVELEAEDQKHFTSMMRMEPAMFHELVERLTPAIEKQHTSCRAPLPPGLKVAITLKYLASGANYKTLMEGFRVADNTISLVVREVCRAIIQVLRPELRCPTTEAEWLEVERGFAAKWNFHHTLGALDGKHIRIKKPPKSGSHYHNYKGFFSIVLLALVDWNYKFLWVECGANGSCSDAQLFNASRMVTKLEEGELNLPDARPLPHDDKEMPYFFIGDDAFALKWWLMKPYSRRNMTHQQAIYNYRCSRARRVVENAFGILANRFQCLLGTMQQMPDAVQDIVLACVYLHNLMRTRYPLLQNELVDREDERHALVPGQWREDVNQLPDIERIPRLGRENERAKEQRVYLEGYYNSPAGRVHWQDQMV